MVDTAKVIGIVALKGGVGKTTVVANLGASLAKDLKKKVLLIDANFSTPHLGLHVGLVNPTHTLHHVLNDEHSVYEAIYQHAMGFHIIPGKLAPTILDYYKLKEVVDQLKDLYDVILIDSSPSLNEEMAAAMASSDEILVVSSPDYPTLSSTLHAIEIAKERGTQIKGIILNKVRGKRFELCSKDIKDASQTPVLASIEDNIKVLSSLSKMLPLVGFSPSNSVSKTYKDLARKIIGEEKKNRSFFKRKKRSDKNAEEIVEES